MAFHSIQCPFCGTIWSGGTGAGQKRCSTCKASIAWDSNGNIKSARPN